MMTHPFETAGLGKAPFRCTGASIIKFQAFPGASIQAGGSCDYCGTAIMQAFWIKSSDNKTFKVGCDCVRRTSASEAPALVKEVNVERLRVLRERRAAVRDNVRAERQQKQKDIIAARRAAFDDEFGPLMTRAATFLERSDFVADVYRRAMRWADISSAQVAAITKAMDHIDAESARRANSQYIGEVGQRLRNFPVTVLRTTNFVRPRFNAYGEEVVYVTTMTTQGGDTLVVMSPSFSPKAGEHLHVTGTIKAHKEYNGERQTILQRVVPA